MMKMIKILLIGFSIVSLACSSSRFIKTGNSYPPLADQSNVRVVAWGDQHKYEVIGIAEIGESSLENRIKEAKRIARSYGGDIVMPKGKHTEEELKSMDEGFQLQSFLVLRTKKEVMKRDVPDKEYTSVDMEPENKFAEEVELELKAEKQVQQLKLSKSDYINLPRATYKLLKEESSSLMGEKFRGSLYPVKYYKIPKELSPHAGKDKKLLELKSKNGKYRLFLLIHKDNAERLKKIVKSKERLNFVYTPVTVYKSEYPVIEFLDVIEKH